MSANLAEAAETIQFPDIEWCVVTRIGLDVKDKKFSYEEWESLKSKLIVMEKGSQFNFGDWLLVGEARHGEKVAQAVDAHDKTGVKIKTLLEYRRVSEKVPYSMRMESLEWTHHQIAANLKAKEARKHWLKQAAENDWTTEQLRREIKAAERPAVDTSAEDDKNYLASNYKNFLLDYIASQYSFLNRCNYEPFKAEIEKTIKAAKYQHRRTLATDYEAVRDQVDKHATTEEEIMEEVPLEATEIKALCDLIVKREPKVYEWRKIGAAAQLENHHGPSAFGIFRVDAPHYESNGQGASMSAYP